MHTIFLDVISESDPYVGIFSPKWPIMCLVGR